MVHKWTGSHTSSVATNYCSWVDMYKCSHTSGVHPTYPNLADKPTHPKKSADCVHKWTGSHTSCVATNHCSWVDKYKCSHTPSVPPSYPNFEENPTQPKKSTRWVHE